jgi:hypothetical protein
MEALEERISNLEALGLIGEMVATEFRRQRVAPFQQHSACMWALNSSSASLHLELALLPLDAVVVAVRLLLGVEQVPPLQLMATPLYDVPEEEDTLGRMLHFDRWGPCPQGTVRDNPCSLRMIVEEVSELEEGGIDPLQTNMNPQAGRNLLVFLSGSSSKEGQCVDPAVVWIASSPPVDPAHSILGEASHRSRCVAVSVR